MTMSRILFLSLTVLAVMFAAPCAFAASALSATQVKSFVDSMGAVDVLADEMKAEGKQEALQANMDALSGDKFLPYTNSIQVLKDKFSGDYAKLGDIVKKHGFSSQEEWAGVGDAVMLSYMALKAEQTSPGYEKVTTELAPEMLEALPPETRVQIEKSMKMVKAVQAAPAENKAAVAPFVPTIDQIVSDQTKQQQ